MVDHSQCAFLFDMDGVICNNNAYHRLSWIEYAKKLGKTLTEQDIEDKVYGKTNEQILQLIFGNSISSQDIDFHAEGKEALFREMYGPHFALTPGLESFLEEAKELGIQLGLATNAPESNLNFTWKAGNLERFFTVAAHPGLVKQPKPAPDLYLYVCEKLQIEPKNAIVFEDSLTGIEAARAAGCEVVAIASTHSVEKLQAVANLVAVDFTYITPAMCLDLL
jgi:beta-phosphoglucomutase